MNKIRYVLNRFGLIRFSLIRFSLIRFSLGAALLPLCLGGCVATSAQVQNVEARVAALEKTNAGVMAGASQEQKRLENLRVMVEESSEQLRQSAAKAGSKLTDFDTALNRVRGELEVLVRRLDALEKASGLNQTTASELRASLNRLIADLRDRAGIAILALPSDLPADADGFAKLAEQRYAAGEVRVAAAVANECQKRFGSTEAAGSCGLVLARIAVEEQRYADATKILQAVHDSLGGKPLPVVGQSLLEIAHVLELQGKCARALEVLKYLKTEMAKLPQAKAAKDLMGTAAARCKEGVGLQGKPAVDAEPKPDAKPEAKPAAKTP